MLLNETLTFDQLPVSVQKSFNGLMAKHERIRAGTMLYKFTDWDLFNTRVDKDGHATESASPFWGTMADLMDVLYYSQKTTKTLLECVRQRNGVLHNWNGLNSLVVIRLQQDVFGFTGNIGSQTEKGYARPGQDYVRHFTGPVAFWGGASQVYLPGLQRTHVEEVVPPETVLIRDSADEILDFLNSLVVI